MQTSMEDARVLEEARTKSVQPEDLIQSASSLAAIGMTRLLRLFIPRAASRGQTERERILVVKLDELGDVLMALPLVAELQRMPDSQVTLVVNKGIEGLFEKGGDVDVLAVDVRCPKWLKPLLLPIRYAQFVSRYSLKGAVSVCLVPRRDTDAVYSISLGYLTKPRKLVSFSEKSGRRKSIANRGFDRLLTHVVPPPPVQHETRSNLSLLSSLRDVEADSSKNSCLEIGKAGAQTAEALLRDIQGPMVAMCPSSGHSALKQWGVERFAELARRISEAGNNVVLVGSPADEELGAAIMGSGVQCLNLIGKTSLQQLAAVIQRCAAFVGNDAGPMHIASALGVPTVAVFGSSCQHMFGPWSRMSLIQVHPVPCSPCGTHRIDRCKVCIHPSTICFDGVSVDQVLDAVVQNLKASDPDRRTRLPVLKDKQI